MDLFEHWAEVVGKDLAAHTTPVTLQDGVLVVTGESADWTVQVHFLRARLQAQINEKFGEGTVTELQIPGLTDALNDFSRRQREDRDQLESTTVASGAKQGRHTVTTLEEMLQPAIDHFDDIATAGTDTTKIPTGFTQLDDLTNGGLTPGSLTVVGGYPGAGTSTLALDLIRSATIRHRIPAAYLTLDSTIEQITHRLLSAETKVQHRNMLSGRMNDPDWTRMSRCMTDIAERPFFLARPDDRDITAVSDQITELADEHGTKLIVIDPLHMLTARRDLPYENREREISEIARRLKALALDTNTAIVTPAYLTNNPGPRLPIPPSPSLSDLRDSGTIAHVADLVILVDRPDLWEKNHPRAGEVDLIVAKHRHSAAAVVITVAGQWHMCRLVEIQQK